MFHDVLLVGEGGLDETFDHLIERGIVDVDGAELVGDEVAQEGGGGVELGMHLGGGVDALQLVGHLRPCVEKAMQVCIELGHRAALGHRAHNQAEILRTDALQQATQTVALLLAPDFL